MLREQVSLQALNTFGVAATARWYGEAASPAELSQLLTDPRVARRPVLVLGGGSNLLLTRDFDGLVLRYTDDHIRAIARGRDSHLIEVGAGMNWHAFVDWSLAHGYVGLENLALIPGTVGAAPIQNIGAYGVELDALVESVQAHDRDAGGMVELELALAWQAQAHVHDDVAVAFAVALEAAPAIVEPAGVVLVDRRATALAIEHLDGVDEALHGGSGMVHRRGVEIFGHRIL